MSPRFVATLLLVSASMTAARQVGMRGAVVPGAPVPAAPAPAGATTPTINTTTVDMEIENLNYYDLTKPQQDLDEKPVDDTNGTKKKHEVPMPESPHSNPTSTGVDDLANTIDNGVGEMLDSGPEEPAKNNTQADSRPPVREGMFSSLQVDNMLTAKGVTVQKALRTAIEDAIKQSIPCAAASPFPAPAPAPAMFLRPPVPPAGMLPPARTALVSRLPFASALTPQPQVLAAAPTPGFAPAPAPGPMSTCPQPQVHVAFQPGSKMKKKHLHLLNAPPAHATVMVKVTLFDRPGNGLNDMQGVKHQLKHAMHTGVLEEKLKDAIHKATGVRPKVVGLKVKTEAVKQWDFKKCGSHMGALVKSFTVHYTRRQVPMALYNECTNFVTKMSFSHDYIMDPRDKARCRMATRKFALSWKLGKVIPQEFEAMCQRFCEAKFGNDAPQCLATP